MTAQLFEFSAKVERLGELARAGVEGAALEAEISAVEAFRDDQEVFFEMRSRGLGEFDLIRYGQLLDAFERRWLVYQTTKDLFVDGLATEDQFVQSFAAMASFWWALEPWREHLRQEIENDPIYIEEARKKALALKGFRDPLASRKKRKPTPEELFNRKLKKMCAPTDPRFRRG